MRGTGADRAKGGEGNGGTDLEVVGEVGVVAAAAGLQVGEAVQLRAHQQRVVHHLRCRLPPRVRAPGSGFGQTPPTETKRGKGNGGFCFASVRLAAKEGNEYEGRKEKDETVLVRCHRHLDENDPKVRAWIAGPGMVVI